MARAPTTTRPRRMTTRSKSPALSTASSLASTSATNTNNNEDSGVLEEAEQADEEVVEGVAVDDASAASGSYSESAAGGGENLTTSTGPTTRRTRGSAAKAATSKQVPPPTKRNKTPVVKPKVAVATRKSARSRRGTKESSEGIVVSASKTADEDDEDDNNNEEEEMEDASTSGGPTTRSTRPRRGKKEKVVVKPDVDDDDGDGNLKNDTKDSGGSGNEADDNEKETGGEDKGDSSCDNPDDDDENENDQDDKDADLEKSGAGTKRKRLVPVRSSKRRREGNDGQEGPPLASEEVDDEQERNEDELVSEVFVPDKDISAYGGSRPTDSKQNSEHVDVDTDDRIDKDDDKESVVLVAAESLLALDEIARDKRCGDVKLDPTSESAEPQSSDGDDNKQIEGAHNKHSASHESTMPQSPGGECVITMDGNDNKHFATLETAEPHSLGSDSIDQMDVDGTKESVELESAEPIVQGRKATEPMDGDPNSSESVVPQALDESDNDRPDKKATQRSPILEPVETQSSGGEAVDQMDRDASKANLESAESQSGTITSQDVASTMKSSLDERIPRKVTRRSTGTKEGVVDHPDTETLSNVKVEALSTSSTHWESDKPNKCARSSSPATVNQESNLAYSGGPELRAEHKDDDCAVPTDRDVELKTIENAVNAPPNKIGIQETDTPRMTSCLVTESRYDSPSQASKDDKTSVKQEAQTLESEGPSSDVSTLRDSDANVRTLNNESTLPASMLTTPVLRIDAGVANRAPSEARLDVREATSPEVQHVTISRDQPADMLKAVESEEAPGLLRLENFQRLSDNATPLPTQDKLLATTANEESRREPDLGTDHIESILRHDEHHTTTSASIPSSDDKKCEDLAEGTEDTGVLAVLKEVHDGAVRADDLKKSTHLGSSTDLDFVKRDEALSGHHSGCNDHVENSPKVVVTTADSSSIANRTTEKPPLDKADTQSYEERVVGEIDVDVPYKSEAPRTTGNKLSDGQPSRSDDEPKGTLVGWSGQLFGTSHECQTEAGMDRVKSERVAIECKELPSSRDALQGRWSEKQILASSLNKERSEDDRMSIDHPNSQILLDTSIQESVPIGFVHQSQMNVKRLNLERVKLALYSRGCKVHGRIGYEKKFTEYWSSLAMVIHGDPFELNMRRHRTNIESFLVTKRIRKLHNKLVLGLLELCYRSSTSHADFEHADWKLGVRPKRAVADRSLENGRLDEKGRSCPPYPTLIFEPLSLFPLPKEYPVTTSFRIPGAMAVDSYVRNLAAATSMKVSDNAIWLFSVAMKEFVQSILKNCIQMKKSVELGQIPPVPHIRQRVLHKKRDIGDHRVESPFKSVKPHPGSNCITAYDIFTLTASMSIGNARSIGGNISRPAFELSQFSSYSTSIQPQPEEFDALKEFFVSKISPSLSMQVQYDQSLSRELDTSQQSRNSAMNLNPEASAKDTTRIRSSHTGGGGLGRGAKDLGALRARSLTQRNAAAAASVVAPAPKQQAPELKQSPPSSVTGPTEAPLDIGEPDRGRPKSDSVVATSLEEESRDPRGSPQSTSQTANVARRGKGFGVKNLAAMRARSITKPADGDEDGDKSKINQAATALEEHQPTPTSNPAESS